MKTIEIDTAKYSRFAGLASFHTAGAEFVGLTVGDDVQLVETTGGVPSGDSMVRAVTDTMGGSNPIVGFAKK